MRSQQHHHLPAIGALLPMREALQPPFHGCLRSLILPRAKVARYCFELGHTA